MKDFYEKWQSDSKYRAKIKLSIYLVFIIIVTIYATSLPYNTTQKEENDKNTIKESENDDIIKLDDNYSLLIDVLVNADEVKYTINASETSKEIIKEKNNEKVSYKYEMGNYYKLQNNNYIETNPKEIYDLIDSTYLDIDNINIYLKKAIKESNQYTIYLKDILLDYEGDDYFIILINNNTINIDYSPLMKNINNEEKNVKVDIEIKE